MLIFLILVIATAGAAMGACIAFDRLLQVIYSRFPAEWERAGRPPGFFWVPSGASWISGWLARQRFVSNVFFGLPSWANGSQDVRRAWRRYICSCVFTFTLIIIGIVGLIWSGSPASG